MSRTSPNIADTLALILKTRGFITTSVHSGEEAVAMASTFLPDIAILDVMLGGLNGIDAASMIVQQRPSCRIVLFSGHPDTAKLWSGARHLLRFSPNLFPPKSCCSVSPASKQLRSQRAIRLPNKSHNPT